MFKFAALVAFVSLALVNAQQAEYAQCGGIGWTGGTTCVSGTTCQELNSYYFQCLPGTATTSTVKTSTIPPTTTPTTHSTTTISTVSSHSSSSSTASAPGGSTTPPPAAGNPFANANIFLSPYYASEVSAAAAQITDAPTATKALSVAKIPTFIWLDSVSKIPSLGTYLAAAAEQGAGTLVQIVIYDLPNRDCHAKASNGEFTIADNGVQNYEGYIDQITTLIAQYPTVKVVAVIEPDSLANLVTNLSDPNCSAAQQAYLTCINYALINLSKVGVLSYMDAGHAGWLGWPANLQPAATLFTQVWQNAGSPPQVRGLATDVSNYNALTTNSPDPITQGDSNYDEMLYITNLAPLLASAGWNAHFIVDQSRSGVQDIRTAWGDWCNVKGAGFGMRPTTNTGSSLIDSVVWVKPGGECDGTSNSSAARYDPSCAQSDALQPAPEAGTWFQQYFVDLVENAVPSL